MPESGSGEPVSGSNADDKESSVACYYCGERFKNNLSLSTHCRYKHDNKPWIPKELLRRLYCEEGMSQREIADELDTTKYPIQNAMQKYGIERRKSKRERVPNHRFSHTSDRINSWYEIVRTHIDGKQQTVPIHRLVAIAHGKMEPSDFNDWYKVVHHKNKYGLDNRPSNLEVMDRGEHQAMHMRENNPMTD